MTDYVVRTVTARKRHRCSDCGRVVDPGEPYRRGVGFDGTAWTWCDCQHCAAALCLYDLTDDEGSYNGDTFQCWADDRDARDLDEARDIAGYLAQWRTKSGKLWPLPKTEGAA